VGVSILVKNRAVFPLLLAAGFLIPVLLAPVAAAHLSTGQTKVDQGYKIFFKTEPAEPTAESSTKLVFSVACQDDGKDANGSLRVEVTEGESKLVDREFTKTKDLVEVSETFPTAGNRKVKVFFEPNDAAACKSSTGKEAKAEFTLTIEEKSFLPAPGLLGAGLALVAATALIARRERDE